jgi:hypothetical protein
VVSRFFVEVLLGNVKDEAGSFFPNRDNAVDGVIAVGYGILFLSSRTRKRKKGAGGDHRWKV